MQCTLFVWNGSSWELFGDEGSYALKATTLAGYGITDAYTKTEIDSTIGVKAEDATPATGLYNISMTKLLRLLMKKQFMKFLSMELI